MDNNLPHTYETIGSFYPKDLDTNIWLLRVPSRSFRVLYIDTGFHVIKARELLKTLTEAGSYYHNFYKLDALEYTLEYLKTHYNITQE